MFGEPERKLRDQVRDHKSSLGEKESGVDDESRVENSKGPHLENIQQVELRGLSDTGGCGGNLLFRVNMESR